jgi:hypothetical protein
MNDLEHLQEQALNEHPTSAHNPSAKQRKQVRLQERAFLWAILSALMPIVSIELRSSST